jgi:hypothetical protein
MYEEGTYLVVCQPALLDLVNGQSTKQLGWQVSW